MKRVSLRTKILRVVMVATGAALLLIAVVVQLVETRIARQRIVEDLSVVGDILGNRSIASLVFSDPESARDNLTAARFNSEIERLCLYDSGGALFSTYYGQNFNGNQCQPLIDTANLNLVARIERSRVDLDVPLAFDNQIIGYLQVHGNLHAVNAQHWYMYLILGCALLMSWSLSYLLATPILKKTLQPLDNLSEAALSMIGNPYSGKRAKIENNDEVGDLVRVLNQMLDNLYRENSALQESESRFRTLAENSPIGIYYKDKSHKLIYANRQWLEMCGIDSITEQDKFYSRIHEGDQRNYLNTMSGVVKDGRPHSVEYQCLIPGTETPRVLLEYIAPLFPESNNARCNNEVEPHGFIGSVLDISDLKSAQSELEQLAFNDTLTQLPNRRFFNDHLNFRISAATKEKRPLAILMIDLDNFKRVNDSLGHDAGDKLLTVIAQRLRHEVFDEDVVSRMGGDEFVVLIESTCSPEKIDRITQKILNVVTRPIGILHQGVEITCSIGIARFPDDARTPKDLLRNADIALYHAKSQGRNCLAYFSSAFNEKVQERVRLEGKLRRAIANGDLSLFIQPQYDTNTDSFVWGEALLRWYDPEEGYIPPDKFIPVAEETGLIVRIGQWVVHEVCKLLGEEGEALNNLGIAGLSINLSARQFYVKNLFKQIQRSIDDYDIDPSRLEFEITESMVMEDVNTANKTMAKLRKLGVKISIDDFGTGYSSLAYLKNFHIDSVKIDRSFVKDLPHDQDDVAITTAILAMADRLGIKVIAEGVETQDQRDFLHSQGCHLMQGFLFAKPATIDQLLGRYPNQSPVFLRIGPSGRL